MAADAHAGVAQPLDARRVHRGRVVTSRDEREGQRDDEPGGGAEGARPSAGRRPGGALRRRRRVAAVDRAAAGLCRWRAARGRGGWPRRRRLLGGRSRGAAKANQRQAVVGRSSRVPSGEESSGDFRGTETEARRESGRSRRHRGYGQTLRRARSPEIVLGQLRVLGPGQMAPDAGRRERQARLADALLRRVRARARACSVCTNRSSASRRPRRAGVSTPTFSTARRRPWRRRR